MENALVFETLNNSRFEANSNNRILICVLLLLISDIGSFISVRKKIQDFLIRLLRKNPGVCVCFSVLRPRKIQASVSQQLFSRSS